MIDNGNVIKNKLIKIKILKFSVKPIIKKFEEVEKITIGIKNGIIKINWMNLLRLTWREIKAERIEIKLNVGKARINKKNVSIMSQKLILNKIEEKGIKKMFGRSKEINIMKHLEIKIDSSE